MNTRTLSPRAARAAVVTIQRHFAHIKDPRVVGRSTYSLSHIITIALLAVLCGYDGWDQMEVFAQEREAWLRELLSLPKGRLPSDETFRRVFGALRPAAFSEAIHDWLRELVGSLKDKLVAIDGKTLRRSFDRACGLSPLHVVHAWVVSNHVLLGHVVTDSKSNEITAVAELLEKFDLGGALVSMDAMGCQRAHAKKLVESGAGYLLAVKENQPKLFAEIETHFGKPATRRKARVVERKERGHGRDELRKVIVSGGLAKLPIARNWDGCRSVVCVERARVDSRLKISVERAFYITTLPATAAERIASAARGHWGVENCLHWTLDVTFREDESRIRDRNGAENVALLRRFTLSMLKNDTRRKGSLRGKRSRAALNPDYALQLLLTPSAAEHKVI